MKCTILGWLLGSRESQELEAADVGGSLSSGVWRTPTRVSDNFPLFFSLAQSRRRCSWIMSTYGCFFTWQSFNLHWWRLYWTVVFGCEFWESSWSCAAISFAESCLFLMQRHPRAQKESQGSITDFWLCPFTQYDAFQGNFRNVLIMHPIITETFKVCNFFTDEHHL